MTLATFCIRDIRFTLEHARESVIPIADIPAFVISYMVLSEVWEEGGKCLGFTLKA